MRAGCLAGLRTAMLVFVLVVAGCQSRQGLYGADDFQSIGQVGGRPAYKAVGYYRYTDPNPADAARTVIHAACPDGNPTFIDGVYGSGRYTYFNQADWWWVTFSCDDEIPLK